MAKHTLNIKQTQQLANYIEEHRFDLESGVDSEKVLAELSEMLEQPFTRSRLIYACGEMGVNPLLYRKQRSKAPGGSYKKNVQGNNIKIVASILRYLCRELNVHEFDALNKILKAASGDEVMESWNQEKHIVFGKGEKS